eukprot:14251918-Alexandrium_andersonii.AAC.1
MLSGGCHVGNSTTDGQQRPLSRSFPAPRSSSSERLEPCCVLGQLSSPATSEGTICCQQFPM